MLKYYIHILLLFALTSCAKENSPSAGSTINIRCGVAESPDESTTRTDPASDSSQNRRAFSLGDEVMLSCFEPSQEESNDYRKYKLTADGWSSSEEPFKWLEPTMRVNAYYPATATPSSFTTPQDQSSAEKIAMADLMRVEAVDKQQGNDNTIELSFMRKMAYIELSVSKFGDIYTPEQNYITDVKVYEYLRGDDGTFTLSPITPFEREQGVYCAIIKGTSGIGRAPEYDLVTFKDAKGAEYSVPNTTYLPPRYKHTLSLIVGGDRDSLSIGSVSVEPWGDPIHIVGGDFDVTEVDKANCIEFSDLDLKKALVQQHNYALPSGEMAYCIDQNGNGEVEFDEAAATTQVAISPYYDPLSYEDLYSYFSNITEFRHLKKIGTMKGDLDISQFPNLKILDLLATSSRANFDMSVCPYLTDLYLFATPKTESVDLSMNSKLRSLRLNIEGVKDLDLTNCEVLEELTLLDTPVEELDLSANTSLTSLSVESSEIKSLNLATCAKLRSVTLEQNESLATLDIATLDGVTDLYCNVAAIKSVDLSNLVALRSLHWAHTGLEDISIESNSELAFLRLEEPEIKSLDISNNNKMSEFMARYVELLTISEGQQSSPGEAYWSSKISIKGVVEVYGLNSSKSDDE